MSCSRGLLSFGKTLHDYLSQISPPKAWWTHGGCWTLARALHEFFGADRTELWGIGSPFTGVAYHVAMKVDSCFLDAEGASTEKEFLDRWKALYPGQYLILRKMTENEKERLLCAEEQGPSFEEVVDRMEREFWPSEILWESFFS